MEESRSSGGVGLSTYGKYFVAGGGWLSFVLFTISCVFTQILFSASDYWLNIWTEAEQIRAANMTPTTVTPPMMNESFDLQSWQEEVDTYTGIYVYSILISGVFVFSLIRTVHFFLMCMLASVNLHNQMFQSVIRAPLSFFDKNPVGKCEQFKFYLI